MPKEPRNPGLEAILEKIRASRNFDFRAYKRATLGRRIARRIAQRKCKSFAAYADLLDREPEELSRLVSSMLIRVTSFFRDPDMWAALRTQVLPDLLARKRPGDEIRVWCAGCATGEEAYSIAILLAEELGARSHAIRVFGTDVDEATLAFARRGVYGADAIAGVPKETLSRWFVQASDGWAVQNDLRRAVVFGVNNLVQDAPISRLDLLLCRNVFIYFDATLQHRILSRFHYALGPEGVLVLGKSELIPFAAQVFEPVDLSRRIYRRSRAQTAFPRPDGGAGTLAAPDGSQDGAEPRASRLPADVLRSLDLPVIATDLDGTVELWNEASSRLWSRNEAQVLDRKLGSLALPGLNGELLVEKTAAVASGRSDRETAEGTVPRPGDDELTIRVEVTSLRNSSNRRSGLLYSVFDVSSARGLEIALRHAVEERQSAYEELQAANEELQSANEELETTNEELQSANEELQTTNEELQSTNEELETTNEELQSTNAELDATNRELALRTEELNLLSQYHRTILRSLSAAVVGVDSAGKIEVWNLAAERLLGLTETEALGQRLWNLRIPALARAVVARLRKAIEARKSLRIDDLRYDLPTGGKGTAHVVALALGEGGPGHGAVVLFEDVTRTAVLAEENRRLRGASASRRATAKPRRRR